MAARVWFIALLFSSMGLAACAIDPQPPVSSAKERDASFWCVPRIQPGKGGIWIYRTAAKEIGLPPDSVVDNRVYEALRHGTAYTINAAPGMHEVKLAYDKDRLEVAVTEGDDAYVRFDIDPALIGSGFTRPSLPAKLLASRSTNTRERTSLA
jgi:hypothetical protein